ncbi:MAG: hypothetical protein WCD76_00845 [Pyrinomonadaceae bacterium]
MRIRHVRPALLPVSLLLVGLCLPCAGRQAKNRASAPSAASETVVFAVKKNVTDDAAAGDATIDPVVIIRGGRFIAPPIETEVEGATASAANNGKRFVANFYRPNRRYRLLFGGGEAGSVSVVKYEEPGCVGLTANARLQTTLKLGGEVDALATNSEKLGGQNVRRAPDESERAVASKLAQSAFRQKNAKESTIAKMKTLNLTAVDLNKDGVSELVGAYLIEGQAGVEHALLMIFERKGETYAPVMTWHHFGSEADAEYRRLVDVLDLDGDGVSELVVQGLYYESHDYMIYKRQAGQWRVAYKGGGGGC